MCVFYVCLCTCLCVFVVLCVCVCRCVCVCTRSCVASVQRVSICGFAFMLACLFACVFKLKEEERAR